jgi:small subunit ribosomal protein S15
MHSNKGGQAGSTKPSKEGSKVWIRYKSKEVELLISKLAKEGKTASQIGLYLRDAYGIPSVKQIAKKSISQILKDKKIITEIPDDIMAKMKISIAIRKHIDTNKQDETAKRGLILTDSKIKRLIKYYKRTGKLNEDWTYDPNKVRMYIE